MSDPTEDQPLIQSAEKVDLRRLSVEYSLERAQRLGLPRHGFGSLLILVGLLILFGVLNAVLFRRVSLAFSQDYAFFVDQGNNILYWILALWTVMWKLKYTEDITAEMQRFPKRKFLLMAVADSFGTFFAFLGAVYTPGQYQTLLNQTLIPVTMVTAAILLGTRYSTGEVVGAFIVLIGAGLAILPGLVSGKAHPHEQVRAYAVILYFISNVPMALSSVYKEKSFKGAKLDCFYLTMWVALYQLLLSFLLAPMQSVPGFGSERGIPAGKIWSDLWDGTRCAFGAIHSSNGAHCSTAGFELLAYSATNFVYNVIGLIVTKRGSSFGMGAVLCTIAYAIKVPITNIVFTSSAIMGKDAEKFTPESLSGLCLVMIGFLLYMYFTNFTSEKGHTLYKSVSDDERAPFAFHDRVVGVAATGTVRSVRRHTISAPNPVRRAYSYDEDFPKSF